MIVFGLIREVFGGGLPMVGKYPGPIYPFGHTTEGLISIGLIYMLAKAFANGGSSLTGIEAVSNAVGALKPPEGRNARQILVTQGSIVAFLIAGISWLAHITHATPYIAGYPTVLAQEANVVFGSGGHFMYFVVQAATALILFTGGNTSFSGFPYLASFVAADSFLPRWLTKRGHRLALSNGIIVLTVVSLGLLVATRAVVNGLIPFYAIGVFTGFTMAGFGMAKYHKRVKERGWRRRRIINTTAAIYTALVVVIFAVVKFTEGAWLIVIVFPVLVYLLIRLNREYRLEAEILEGIGDRRAAGVPPRQPNYRRRVVLIFVDDVDLATFAAIRYARGLRPTTMRAVHFVIDSAQAETLREQWVRYGQDIPLEMIDTPDRRLTRASLELVSREAEAAGHPGHGGAAAARLRPAAGAAAARPHRGQDRLGDQPGAGLGRHHHPLRRGEPGPPAARQERRPAWPPPTRPRRAADQVEPGSVREKEKEQPTAAGTRPQRASRRTARRYRPREPNGAANGVTSIAALEKARKATIEGRVSAVEIRPVENSCVFEATIADGTGSLTAMFYGRTHIPGLEPGVRIRLDGKVSMRGGGPAMINPAYELLAKDG